MLSIFKKMFKTDPRSKSIEEFKSLKTLEAKRKAYVDSYEVSDETEAQKDILRNNFETLAHIFGTLDTNNKNRITGDKMDYFNLQCTPTKVITSAVYVQGITNSITDSSGDFLPLDVRYCAADMLTFERKMQNDLPKQMKSGIRNKLERIAKKKMDNEIIKYCNDFKGNEDLVRAFIFRDLSEPDEDYHNIYKVIDRLNFIGFLDSSTKGILKNSDNFYIGEKTLISIKESALTDYASVVLFLEKLQQKRFDFVIQYA